ncbi:MAG: hypothetical protein A2622_09715 [Bdellovibrionales bacterium RIFCSPHIGHO2_01_FULL_40_29]|nr:MAG: hypothetical protein A2622_09715 [Bdellovibrionales bacterium RIFCSPHIGHO2_01_FULL_40_29]OFZ32472.1 MAG: hypothetical protein A3D17_12950 [Bdellovibrionales bacterium RIFCSPHIGHO2_02_FULL_40_15]
MRKFIYVIPIIFLILSAFYFYEYIRIGLVKDQTIIESYHFGDEPMVAAGGWPYLSAEAYAGSSLLNGSLLFLSAIMFGIGINKSVRSVWLVALVPIVVYAIHWILSIMNPPNI